MRPQRALVDTDLMPFGKHKGRPMSDVPVNYLNYLWMSGLNDQAQRSERKGQND